MSLKSFHINLIHIAKLNATVELFILDDGRELQVDIKFIKIKLVKLKLIPL